MKISHISVRKFKLNTETNSELDDFFSTVPKLFQFLFQEIALWFNWRTDVVTVTNSPVRLSGADRKCRHGTVLQTQASVLSRDPPTTMVIQHTSTCKMPTSKSHRASAGTTLKLLMRKSAAAKAASATGLRIATASSQTQPMMPLRLFSDCYFCI